MRRISIFITSFVLVLSGLALSPANAVSTLADGTYDCNTGFSSSATPNYTITSDVVSLGTACSGSVTIPEGVTNIGIQAFQGATAVTAIDLPLSLTNIEPFAFSGATSISSISIPKNVSIITETAFLGMTSLSEITVDAANTRYASDAGVLFSASKSVLYVFPAGKVINGGIYSVPNTVNFISDHAFRMNGNLAGITIPASVTGVGYLTFADSLLKDFFFEGDAPTPDANSFSALTANAYVKTGASGYTPAAGKWNGLDLTTGFPSLLSCGSAGYFKVTNNAVTGSGNCAGDVEIPTGVTSILGGSFQDRPVTKVTFASPSTVTSIGSFAFAGATIASLNFPASVTSIGPYAFGWQWTDAEFVDPAAIPTALTNVTFDAGSTLTSLGRSAFAPNTNLRAITLPSTLTTLGPEVFDGDTSLAEITFLGSEPTLEEIGIPLASNAFRGLPLTAKVNVPWNATGFTLDGDGKWNGLTVVRAVDPAIAVEAARLAAAQAAAANDLANRTITAKKKYVAKPLATKVGVTIVSSKSKVSISVSRGSKQVCTKSGSKLKTLKAGSCLVTFTVQEPKPKGGKKPKATKTVKTLVVQ